MERFSYGGLIGHMTGRRPFGADLSMGLLGRRAATRSPGAGLLANALTQPQPAPQRAVQRGQFMPPQHNQPRSPLAHITDQELGYLTQNIRHANPYQKAIVEMEMQRRLQQFQPPAPVEPMKVGDTLGLVITRVEAVIWDQQFAGAAAGLLNPRIVAASLSRRNGQPD